MAGWGLNDRASLHSLVRVNPAVSQSRCSPRPSTRNPSVAAFPGYGYYSHMEKTSVSRLKNSLSAYLRKVRAGQSVVIYDRDVPIARIDRIEDGGRGADRLALLAAQGITRPATRALSAKRLRALVPKAPGRARVLDALREERSQDR